MRPGAPTFEIVADPQILEAAQALLNERYGARGYGAAHVIPVGAHHTTFAAMVEGEVVGTVTLSFDGPGGLAVARTFGSQVDRIRAQPGAKACELTKLAVRGGARSKANLAGLFQRVLDYGAAHTSAATDLLIEVNPRHAPVYAARLGFERIGPIKTNPSVAAPSQLMRLKVATIRERRRASA